MVACSGDDSNESVLESAQTVSDALITGSPWVIDRIVTDNPQQQAFWDSIVSANILTEKYFSNQTYGTGNTPKVWEVVRLGETYIIVISWTYFGNTYAIRQAIVELTPSSLVYRKTFITSAGGGVTDVDDKIYYLKPSN